MRPKVKQALVCVALWAFVCGREGFAQSPRPLARQGRIQILADTSGALMLVVGSKGSPAATRAILELPSVVLRDGRRFATHLSATKLVLGESSGLPVAVEVTGSCDYGANEPLTAIWLIRFPQGADDYFTVSVELSNSGKNRLEIARAVTVSMSTDARWFGADSSHAFWSFQGGTYPERPDWAFPLVRGFSRDNFQGMNAPDYGGGMPIVDLWTRKGGIAIGSLAPRPEQLALPVRAPAQKSVRVGIEERDGLVLQPGETRSLQPFVVIFHGGDFFAPLRTYYRLILGNDAVSKAIPPTAYEPEWCAWGYGRSFVPDQIFATLGLVRSLGIGWVTVDDGYQNADGDWLLDRAKFPQGDRDMKRLVDSIHALGFKAMLWWVPFEAHDSSYSVAHFPGRMKEFGSAFQSNLAKKHPDWFQLNADGSRTQVSWWNSYTLCPAVPEVRDYYKALVERFIRVWGFDGFKIDGQNMNAVPPCYNPAHHHGSPYDAPRAVPLFFREISLAARAVSPDVVFYVCACGTNFSVYNLPYLTIPVAADPLSPLQVRQRAKVYKAMLGGTVPYCGDHVELTNRTWDDAIGGFRITGDEDFASTIGVGGVPATKFTSPGVEQPDSSLMLDARKKASWRHWLDIYRRERLSRGEYMNLYDIGYDRPETHVVARGDTLYFSLYDDGEYSGAIQLRGLLPRRYRVTDYVRDRTLGEVVGPVASFDATFDHALLLKVIPLN